MAAETVDPIDGRLPQPFTGLYPLDPRAWCKCWPQIGQLQTVGCERAPYGMPGHRTACPASQGIHALRIGRIFYVLKIK